MPAHALAKGLEFGVGRVGHRHQRHIVVGQVLIGAIEVVREERAALAAIFPAGAEHEVVDQQLAVLAKQVRQAQRAIGALKLIGLVDFYPGQRPAFGAELVALAGEGLLVDQVLFAGL